MRKTIQCCLLLCTLVALSASVLAHPGGDEKPGGERFWFGHPGTPSTVNRTIQIRMLDIRFEPTTLTVQAGDTVKFEIANQGALEHEFLLADASEQVEHEKEVQAMPTMKMDHINGVSVAPGKSATLTWTFTQPGDLEYGCHVPGHFAAGMVGQLVVKPRKSK